MIRTLPIRDLNDIFRLVPGFQTYPNNTESARVVYHGLTDEEFSPRLQVLVDGRSMYSPAFRSGVDWALIPVTLENIERIEVVRGTNAVSYGSNAFLGVINIITVDPSLVTSTTAYASKGSQNVRDHGFRTGGKLGEAGDFRLTYRHQNDDGLRDQYDWIDSYATELMDFRADFALSNQDNLELNLGQALAVTQRGRLITENNQVKLDASGNPTSNPSNPIRDYDQRSTYAQVRWSRTLSADAELSLRFAHTADQGDDEYTKPANPAPYKYSPWGASSTRDELEFQHILSLSPTIRLVWGSGWRLDRVSANTTLKGQGWVERDVSRLFGNLEWKPASWFTGNLGLASEEDSMAGSNLSPRLSGAFHLNEENTLRIGASRAYRTGSVVDYRGDWWDGNKHQFQGDTDMPAERMDTYELGYLGNWHKLRMSLDVRLFQEKIHDRLLEADRDSQTPGKDLIPNGMLPIQDIRMRGIEYQLKWQPFDPTRVLINQAFLRAKADFTDAAKAYPNSSIWQSTGTVWRSELIDELAERGAPRHATAIFISQKLPYNLELSAAGYWQDKLKWSMNTWGEQYHRVDVRLAHHFRIAGKRGEIACVSQSLNGTHPEYKAYNQPHDRQVERRTWVTLSMEM